MILIIRFRNSGLILQCRFERLVLMSSKGILLMMSRGILLLINISHGTLLLIISCDSLVMLSQDFVILMLSRNARILSMSHSCLLSSNVMLLAKIINDLPFKLITIHIFELSGNHLSGIEGCLLRVIRVLVMAKGCVGLFMD